MADNRIRFSIDSVFNGEGFAKASRAVKDTSGVVKNAADGVTKLSGEFGALGGAVGKVSDGVGKLSSAMSGGSMGLIGLVATVTVSTAKWLIDFHNRLQKVRAEHAKLMHDMAEGYQNRLRIYSEKAKQAALDAMQASIDSGLKAIETIDRLASAYQRLGAAEDAASKSGRAVRSAEIDVALAYQANMDSPDEQKRREIQARIDKEALAYADALEDAKRKQLDATEKVSNVAAQYNVLKDVIDKMRSAGQDAAKQEEKLQTTEIALAAARKELEAATNGVKVAELEHTARVYSLENEQTRLEAAIQEREEKERAAAEKAQAKADAEARATTQIAKLTATTQKEVAKLDAQIKAQDEYIRDVKQQQQRAKAGMDADAKHTSGTFGPYDYSRDANGNINDYEDWQRSQRFADRAARDQANTDRRNQRIFDRADKLQKKQDDGKKLTRDEQKELDRANKFRKQLQDAGKEEEKKKQLEDDRKKLIDQLGKDVTQIKNDLKKALEVQ